MAFDKAAYWAQKGQPRAKGRACTMIICPDCKKSEGTLYWGNFVCNNRWCQEKLQRRLAEHMVALEGQRQSAVLAQADKVLREQA